MFSRLFLFLCSFKRVFFFSFYNVYLTLPVFSVTKSGTSGFQRFYSRPSRPVCQQVIEECFKVVHRNHSESQDTLWAVVWQHVIWNLQERSPQCMACLLLILTVSFSFWMESPMVPAVQWEWGDQQLLSSEDSAGAPMTRRPQQVRGGSCGGKVLLPSTLLQHPERVPQGQWGCSQMRGLYTTTWMSAGEGAPLSCGWGWKLVQLQWRTVWSFLSKLKTELLHGSSNPNPGVYPENTLLWKDIPPPCTQQHYLQQARHGNNLSVHPQMNAILPIKIMK